jgi:hypothetical protein
VVDYFNAGVPQDAVAGAALTLSSRFTNPRGPGLPPGLGLSRREVDDLTDFLENGLYDPAFAHFDPRSTTRTFQPNKEDLTYSKYRPDLAALGAIDGRLISGLAIDNNDALSRRDEGLEFLDVTNQLSVTRNIAGERQRHGLHEVQITNRSSSVVDTHLLIIVGGLSPKIRLANASGITTTGEPYLRVFLPNGVLNPGDSISRSLVFLGPEHGRDLNYTLKFLSGQGRP